MDPNANLKEQLELANKIRRAVDGEENVTATEVWSMSNRLAELVLSLDSWLRGQGFPPSKWTPSLPALRMEARR